jgi:hypothetical protein
MKQRNKYCGIGPWNGFYIYTNDVAHILKSFQDRHFGVDTEDGDKKYASSIGYK